MAIQRMAVVDGDNKVVNVIVYDTEGTWTPPEGCRLVDASKCGGPGDTLVETATGKVVDSSTTKAKARRWGKK